MSISHYLEGKVFEHFFKAGGAAAVAQPVTLTVGLHTADPGEVTGTTAEVAGGSYGRQTVAFAAPAVLTNGTTISNSGALTFPKATANWGTISHASVWDGTNYLFSGQLTVGGTPTPQTVNTNGQLIFDIGTFTIKLD